MSTTTVLDDVPAWAAWSDWLAPIAELPAWLTAIVQSESMREILARAIPSAALNQRTIQQCEIRRVRMKKQRWSGIYQLTLAGPAGQQSTLLLQATLFPPGLPGPATSAGDRDSGADGWQCYVPELRLLLEMQPEEADLPSLATLTDPERARAVLEQSMRSAAPKYRDLQIQSCLPRVVRYKPGSRCTILYDLIYPGGRTTSNGWPKLVAVKTYKGGKGKNAHAGLRALWESPLGASEIVTIAEPLGYVAELSALVQGPIREEQTLKDLIRAALRADTPKARAELSAAMRKTAAGLAALHRSGVSYGEVHSWDAELAEVRETVAQLGAVFPRIKESGDLLLARLTARAAAYPADPAVPTHASFRPAQVLLAGGAIGFIDFDSFCQSEPALDLALFLSATKNVGLSEPHEEESGEDDATLDPRARAALLDQLDVICDEFLSEYERHAPVSRQRVALWESLDLLTLVLTCWTKVKPVRLDNTLAMLERHLNRHRLLPE